MNMADNDVWFVCKICGRFHTDAEVTEWDTKWTMRDGENSIAEIIHRCPLCGEFSSYKPNEAKFRYQIENKAGE